MVLGLRIWIYCSALSWVDGVLLLLEADAGQETSVLVTWVRSLVKVELCNYNLYPFLYILFYFLKMFIDERERERERNIDQLTPINAPTRESNLQPRYVPWPGIKPPDFWCLGRLSNQLSHQARALYVFYMSVNSLFKSARSSLSPACHP